MKNADAPRPDPRRERLLTLDPTGEGSFAECTVANLPRHLKQGDVLVVNDAAALPASLTVCLERRRDGNALELRLAGTGGSDHEWWAVLFGEGSWQMPTENRPAPPSVRVGDTLRVHDDVAARVEEVSPLSPRLLRVRFNHTEAAFYDDLYRHGRPVQYSYLRDDLPLWEVQTPYSARPWAMEMPSAGRPLTWDLLLALRGIGVRVARLTHAAGLSSTGDASLDARLPLPERYEIPEATVRAIELARKAGGRVIAAGTTSVRALEGDATAHNGRVTAGTGITDLVLGPDHRLQIVDGLLTGIHEPGTSHFALMRAFAPTPLLENALRHAETHGFRQHEFGDSVLVLPRGR
jgi:S-adenosylmethionine:tRNA ribosyltransferase-isomerase